ncbi:MAG: hypothetical protein WKF73_00625 [Nocardioidaceae bacterium]
MVARLDPNARALLHEGLVIPAHPLALDARGVFEQPRQEALTRYYLDAGAGGLAVGVHTTQFAVHQESVGLYELVLRCAAETTRSWTDRRVVLVAGIVGPTEQAVAEAEVAGSLGYDLGLLGITGAADATEEQLIDRARAVGEVLPVFGFYLQPAVGGVATARSSGGVSPISKPWPRSRLLPSTVTARSTSSAQSAPRNAVTRLRSTPAMTTAS